MASCLPGHILRLDFTNQYLAPILLHLLCTSSTVFPPCSSVQRRQRFKIPVLGEWFSSLTRYAVYLYAILFVSLTHSGSRSSATSIVSWAPLSCTSSSSSQPGQQRKVLPSESMVGAALLPRLNFEAQPQVGSSTNAQRSKIECCFYV